MPVHLLHDSKLSAILKRWVRQAFECYVDGRERISAVILALDW